MQLSAPTAWLAFSVACAYTLLFVPWVQRRLDRRLQHTLLAVLAAASLVAHLDVLRWSPDGGLGLRGPIPHVYDIYHYYLGTKYFRELGHTGLYEATVVADSEDDAEHLQPSALIRNLESGRLDVSRREVLERSDTIRGRFTKARWAAFKHDVGVLRSWIRSDVWHAAGPLVDHGYNATPLLTALLGGLANSGLVSIADFGGWLRWLDVYLILLVGIFLAGFETPVTGLGFLVFAFANPLHDYGFVGGAYLRSDYLLPLVFAVLALRRGWQGACGGLLAVSGLMRIFPLLLPVVIALHDLLHADGLMRLRSRARLYGVFVTASLALFVLTSLIPAPGGRNPWLAFADNLRGHTTSRAVNRIGIAALVDSVNVRSAPDSRAHDPSQRLADWEEQARQDDGETGGLALAASLLLVIGAIAAARSAPVALLPLSWMLMLYALQPLSHYYWAMLAIVPVMAGTQRWLHALGGATLALLALTAGPILSPSQGELRFAIYGAEVLGFLLIGCLAASRVDVHAESRAAPSPQ